MERVYPPRPVPNKLGHDWNDTQWLAKARLLTPGALLLVPLFAHTLSVFDVVDGIRRCAPRIGARTDMHRQNLGAVGDGP